MRTALVKGFLIRGIAAALVLAGAAWALGKLRDRLLSRRPNYAWVPLAAISGLTYMSGLPDRWPVGWGYSYLDVMSPWFVVAAICTSPLRTTAGRMKSQ